MTVESKKQLSSIELRFSGRAEDYFSKALKRQMDIHEGVTLLDLLKFLYQSSLGSFHLSEMMNEKEMMNWIGKNLENTELSDGLLVEDLLGRKWVRLNFGPFKKMYGNDHQKIYAAFMKAKSMKQGSIEDFKRLLEKLLKAFRKGKIKPIDDKPKALSLVEDFLREYEKSAYPPVHHSKIYMQKNTSDYLVIPRSSLTIIERTDKHVAEISRCLTYNELMRRAVEFHGHLGPFLVLGLKAGLEANSVLGKDCFKTKAIVTTRLSPPNSCFVDGIQFVTGCTMGKRNIELRNGKETSVLFTKGELRLRLKVKEQTLHAIKNIKSEREAGKESTRLMKETTPTLFDIEGPQ